MHERLPHAVVVAREVGQRRLLHGHRRQPAGAVAHHLIANVRRDAVVRDVLFGLANRACGRHSLALQLEVAVHHEHVGRLPQHVAHLVVPPGGELVGRLQAKLVAEVPPDLPVEIRVAHTAGDQAAALAQEALVVVVLGDGRFDGAGHVCGKMPHHGGPDPVPAARH